VARAELPPLQPRHIEQGTPPMTPVFFLFALLPDPAARRSVGGMTRWRAWSLASAAAAAITTSVYLIVITIEGNNSVWDVFPWAMLMVVGSAASLWSALSHNILVSRSMAIGAAVVLGVVGVVAMFSVGLGLLFAAILAGVAAVKASQPAT
jgi:hypothetical protein